jgi:hypothetical protein
MPHHQQLRTLANFSSKPYIETTDQKKKEKTELLQTRDTYVKFSFSPSEKKKRGKQQQSSPNNRWRNFHLNIYKSEPSRTFYKNSPNMQASCATNTQRTEKKKEPTRRAPSDIRWDWDPKILAQFTPRVERLRSLSLSLRARIPVCTRAQKLDETLTTISNVRLKILSSQTHPQKAYLPGFFFFLFFVFSFLWGFLFYFFSLFFFFFWKGGVFLARKYILKYLWFATHAQKLIIHNNYYKAQMVFK